jgi:membrane associated rhomboid family serine protease
MFIAIPVGMNYRTERYPLVTLSLIGINTLVWLVTLICFFSTDGESDKWITAHLWLVPAQSFLWMYVTSMFVHAGFFHLLGNMIFLFLFGACVEDIIGRLRFAIFYLVAGLVAELVYIAMSPGHFSSPMPMGGASGAISGCMGMYLLLRAEADIEFKYFIWLFFVYVRAGEFEIPAWMAISFWFLKDLLWAVLGMVSPHPGGGTAFGAHVGGFLGGLALIYFYKLIEQRQEQVEGKTDLIIDPTQAMLSAAAAQKISEISTSELPTIFLHDGIAQTGPFTLTQVQAMLQRGAIGRDASYWSEGMSDWENVAELSSQPLA